VHDSIEPGREDNSKNSPKKRGRNKRGLFVILLIIIGLIYFSRSEPVNTIDCTPEIIASKPDVIMLGAWWCSYCYKAKKYFQSNNINYCEYDMENTETGKRLYQENGGGAVPILLIGKHRLKGFSESQIEQALSLLRLSPEQDNSE
jgi:glutaredoxin